MGKLVLFLKDQSPVEIPLAKERVTIGRRADNDVCLPYPAVSGEHAAVVTILADSFLEDLGSTNGTLVNGRPIAKHFLRDRDQIDIGRQLLVFLADVEAHAEPPPTYSSREDRRDLSRRIDAIRPRERMEPTPSVVDEDLGVALGVLPAAPAPVEPLAPPPSPPEAPPRDARPAESEPPTRIPTEPVPDDTTFDAELARLRSQRPAPIARGLTTTAVQPAAPPAHGRVRVLTGPSAGRVVDIRGDSFVIGRVGVQVAAIERRGEALWLMPREGAAPPAVNGVAIPPEGRELVGGDGLEIAGTRLELVSEE